MRQALYLWTLTTSYSFSFVLLQCLLLALYRIVFPVLILLSIVKQKFAFQHKSKNLPDPLRDGPVLLPLLGQDALHPEGLQSRHGALQEALKVLAC